jgi:hypothetical protein
MSLDSATEHSGHGVEKSNIAAAQDEGGAGPVRCFEDAKLAQQCKHRNDKKKEEDNVEKHDGIRRTMARGGESPHIAGPFIPSPYPDALGQRPPKRVYLMSSTSSTRMASSAVFWSQSCVESGLMWACGPPQSATILSSINHMFVLS